MPMAAQNAYIAELPGLLAELRMQTFDGAVLPHLKPGARRRIMRETQRLAYGDAGQRVVASPRALAMIGIRVISAGKTEKA